MKKTIIKSLLAMACLLSSTSVSAYDFKVDGIYYNVVSLSEQTCEVANGNYNYSGDIVIPATVDYGNRTLTVVRIADEVFKKCSGLTGITIPNTISSIGNNMFDGCSELERVTIEDGESVLEFGYKYIGGVWDNESLFDDCPITSLYIGRNLSYKTTDKGPRNPPFYRKSSIKDLTIGDLVTEIDTDAFYYCVGLTNVTIGNSVKKIAGFNGCTNLKKVIVKDLAAWCRIYFSGSSSNPLYYAKQLYSDEDTEIKDLVIPEGVTSIESDAFSGCSGLISVTIPNSVTSIGSNAFQDCKGLKKVIVKDIAAWCGISFGNSYSNPLYWSEHLYSDEETEITDLVIPEGVKSISSRAFHDFRALISLTIPNSVIEIGSSAFANCSSLDSVAIPNSVTTIGSSAFSGCSALKSVTIGTSVTSIGSSAFYGCSGLTTLYSLNTTPPSAGTFTNNQYMTLNVFVPQEALEAYQNAEPWSNFWNLQGDPTLNVEKVESKNREVNNVYYDLRGKRLNAPKRGLNIINHKKVMMNP